MVLQSTLGSTCNANVTLTLFHEWIFTTLYTLLKIINEFHENYYYRIVTMVGHFVTMHSLWISFVDSILSIYIEETLYKICFDFTKSSSIALFTSFIYLICKLVNFYVLVLI